jgi:hypothetical protein
MTIQVRFLGAAQTVTGAMHLRDEVDEVPGACRVILTLPFASTHGCAIRSTSPDVFDSAVALHPMPK